MDELNAALARLKQALDDANARQDAREAADAIIAIGASLWPSIPLIQGMTIWETSNAPAYAAIDNLNKAQLQAWGASVESSLEPG